MIIMGGSFPNSTSCDEPLIYGQHNMNLGQNNPHTAFWNRFELNFPPYTIPSSIVNVIGGKLVLSRYNLLLPVNNLRAVQKEDPMLPDH